MFNRFAASLGLGVWCAALIVLAGCASNDAQINRDRREDAQQGMAAPRPGPASVAEPAVVQPPVREAVMPFRYTAKRFHAIQESSNLVDWVTLPGLANCGAPSTNADLFVTNNLKERAHYWRALGHDDWWVE